MTADLLTFPTLTPPAPAEPSPRTTDPQALDWRARIEALPEDKDPCPGYRPGEWARTRAAILKILDRFGDELVRLGWTERDLFGVHHPMGVMRVDGCGGLVLSELIAERVTADTIRRGNLTFYREKPGIARGPAIWEYRWPERRASKPGDGWR